MVVGGSVEGVAGQGGDTAKVELDLRLGGHDSISRGLWSVYTGAKAKAEGMGGAGGNSLSLEFSAQQTALTFSLRLCWLACLPTGSALP